MCRQARGAIVHAGDADAAADDGGDACGVVGVDAVAVVAAGVDDDHDDNVAGVAGCGGASDVSLARRCAPRAQPGCCC